VIDLNESSDVVGEVLYSNGAGVGWDPNVAKDLTETTGVEGESLTTNGAEVDWDSIANGAGVD